MVKLTIQFGQVPLVSGTDCEFAKLPLREGGTVTYIVDMCAIANYGRCILICFQQIEGKAVRTLEKDKDNAACRDG